MRYIFILLLCPLEILAQPGYRIFDFFDPYLKSLNVGIQLGSTSYFGDLSTTEESYKNINRSIGISTKFRFNDYFFTNLDVNYYRIEAQDHIIKRNLSFRSDNFEVVNLYNFEFFNYNSLRMIKRSEFPIGIHIFCGIGFTTNNPKAFYNDQWIDLRPLRTENYKYNPVSLIFPIGIGISYEVNKDFTISMNSSYRFTNTDYLDDVSSVYADPKYLPNELSRQLMHRGSVWYGPSSKRGNPTQKDGYLITNLKLDYKLPIRTNISIFDRFKPKYR